MNKTSTEKIRSATPFLIRFRRCLPHPIQAFVRPYLDEPYQLALSVLDGCNGPQALTTGSIARQAGVTPETVRQVLLALQAGGLTFSHASKRKWHLVEAELRVDIETCLSTCLTTSLSTCLTTSLSTCLTTSLTTSLATSLTTSLTTSLATDLTDISPTDPPSREAFLPPLVP